VVLKKAMWQNDFEAILDDIEIIKQLKAYNEDEDDRKKRVFVGC